MPFYPESTVLGALLLLTLAGLVGLRDSGLRPAYAIFAARIASYAVLAIALLLAAQTFFNVFPADQGEITALLSGHILLDPLSTILFLLVSFIGVIVLNFSRNYLDGNARQGAFMGWMCLTLASVSTLLVSGSLVLFGAAWVATSLSLHKLLLFFSDRRAAQLAARKKFLFARLGDAALLVAFGLLALTFWDIEIKSILASLDATTATPVTAVACVLIAIAALLKSAQFPTHGWLIEVMETPTPVSALLHAGIVNAGGFLIIRFADLFMVHTASLWILAVVGTLTALIASVSLLTQTSIKSALAWSTVGQMGLMIMQCGFGAFTMATLHIVAHSLYKSHAFLSSGSVIDKIRIPSIESSRAGFVTFLIAAVAASLVFIVTALMSGQGLAEKSGILVFAVVMVLGLARFFASGLMTTHRAVMVPLLVISSAGLALLYFGAHTLFENLLGTSVPKLAVPDASMMIFMAVAAVGFILITALQYLPRTWGESRFVRRLQVHAANGFYANAILNRLVGANRFVRIGDQS